MEKNQLKVKLLGTSFTIQSAEEREKLEKVLAYYKEKIEEIDEKLILTDPLKAAIIAGLNIVDELFKEKVRMAGEDGVHPDELKEITDRLINKIDNSINDLMND